MLRKMQSHSTKNSAGNSSMPPDKTLCLRKPFYKLLLMKRHGDLVVVAP